jgi:hypothetical protein
MLPTFVATELPPGKVPFLALVFTVEEKRADTN